MYKKQLTFADGGYYQTTGEANINQIQQPPSTVIPIQLGPTRGQQTQQQYAPATAQQQAMSTSPQVQLQGQGYVTVPQLTTTASTAPGTAQNYSDATADFIARLALATRNAARSGPQDGTQIEVPAQVTIERLEKAPPAQQVRTAVLRQPTPTRNAVVAQRMPNAAALQRLRYPATLADPASEYTWTYSYGESETVTPSTPTSLGTVSRLVAIYKEERDQRKLAKERELLKVGHSRRKRQLVAIMAFVALASVLFYAATVAVAVEKNEAIVVQNSYKDQGSDVRMEQPLESLFFTSKDANESTANIHISSKTTTKNHTELDKQKELAPGPAIIQTKNKPLKNGVCSSPECFARVANIMKSVTKGISPCSDFYGYACSHWRRLHTEQRHLDSVDNHLTQLLIHDAYEILTQPSNNTAFSKIRSILLACTSQPKTKTFEAIQQSVLSAVSLDSWPYLSNEDSSGVSVPVTLSKFIKVFGFDPLFGTSFLDIETNLSNSTRSRLALFGPQTIIKGPSLKSDPKVFESSVTSLLGTRNHYLLKNMSIFTTEQRFVNSTEFSRAVLNHKLRNNDYITAKISSLPELAWFNWKRFFLEVTGTDQFDDEILLPDKYMFERMESFGIYNLSVADISNYLGFRALLVFSPFSRSSPQTYSAAVGLEYLNNVHGTQIVSEREACVHFVNRIDPIFSMIRLNQELSYAKNLGKNEFINDLQSFVRKTVPNILPIQKSSRVVYTLNQLQWDLFGPVLLEHGIFSERIVDSYSDLNDSTSTDIAFSFPTFLRSIGIARAMMMNDFGSHYWHGGLLSSRVHFRHALKNIEIPILSFDIEYLEHNGPDYSHLPRILPRIAEAIVAAVLQVKIDGIEWENFQNLVECVAKDYGNINAAGPRRRRNLDEYYREAVETQDAIDILSLTVAYNLYVKFMQEKGMLSEDSKSGNSMLPLSQLFFLEYAQSRCDTAELGKQAVFNSHAGDVASIGWYRINGALRHVSEFSDAFNCSRKTLLNPPTKCHLEVDE